MKIMIQESLSMPRVIPEFKPPWGESKELNEQYLKKWKKASEPFRIFKMGKTPCVVHRVMSRFGKEILYVSAIESPLDFDTSYAGRELIQYSVVVENVHLTGLLNIKAASQVSVWRNDGYPGLPNLAKKIFLEELLPRSGWILSDSVQSVRGKIFWEKRVDEALSKSRNVYALGVSGENYEVEQVHKIDEFSDLALYYSKELPGEYWRILIGGKLPDKVLGFL